ncbi:MAG: 2-oxoacid:acceptor oxidoreductase family protein [Planctomycetota bacterium]|jgi:2-oxoglutarate ferredoxin oxidoreductase subunit gamma
MKIRFSGFGGQGVVLCGLVFGEAAMLDGKNSLQTQAYGSASRGGLTRSDVCVQDDEIHDLVFDDLDALVAMSQQAFDAYAGEIGSEGRLFVESDMVDPGEGSVYGIPATDIAFKEFGRKVMANMVIMGFVNETLGLLSHEAIVTTIRKRVPPGTEDKNEAAYREGIRLAAEGSA